MVFLIEKFVYLFEIGAIFYSARALDAENGLVSTQITLIFIL